MLLLLAFSSVKNHVLDVFKWVPDVLEGSSFLGLKPLFVFFFGPTHTNALSKFPIFMSAKTKQTIFIHISVFVSFLSIHTETLENDVNDLDLGLRMCES